MDTTENGKRKRRCIKERIRKRCEENVLVTVLY